MNPYKTPRKKIRERRNPYLEVPRFHFRILFSTLKKKCQAQANIILVQGEKAIKKIKSFLLLENNRGSRTLDQ